MAKPDNGSITDIKSRLEMVSSGPWGWLYTGERYLVVAPNRTDLLDNLTSGDAVFISHAREDIPTLLAHIASLEAKVATLAPVVAKAQETFTTHSYTRQMPLLKELSAMARSVPDERGSR